MRPKSKPYTDCGIKRIPCVRCGGQGYSSWHICADGNQPRVFCRECDIEANRLAMTFAFGAVKSRKPMRKYEAKMRSEPEMRRK